jgi:hypothetical protein
MQLIYHFGILIKYTLSAKHTGTICQSIINSCRHRWSGKYEAHLWDSSCRVEGRRRKGKQGINLFLTI